MLLFRTKTGLESRLAVSVGICPSEYRTHSRGISEPNRGMPPFDCLQVEQERTHQIRSLPCWRAADGGSGRVGTVFIAPGCQLFVKHLFYEELKRAFLAWTVADPARFYWNGHFLACCGRIVKVAGTNMNWI